MASKVVSTEDMQNRVSRLSQINFSEAAFLDSVLPEYQRKIGNIIGAGVTEDPSMRPAITAVEGFNIGFIQAERGKGASLHSHSTVEVFMPLKGQWEIFWGDEGEEVLELDTFDVISVPTGIMRGFRSASDGDNLMMAIVGGNDAGKVAWPQSLLDRAKDAGWAFDDDGNIVEIGTGRTTRSVLAGRESGETAKSRPIKREEVLSRVARFGELNFSEAAFIDAALPEYERKIFSIIGAGVTEDASLKPAITAVEDFNLTLIKAAEGKGASLHSHSTVEVFMPLSGRWVVYWGEDGENEIELDPFDVISVPTEIMRGFRNISGGEQLLLAIIGGEDAGKVVWPDDVIKRAESAGLSRDVEGNIVHAAS